jgi:hypothetical protein
MMSGPSFRDRLLSQMSDSQHFLVTKSETIALSHGWTSADNLKNEKLIITFIFSRHEKNF